MPGTFAYTKSTNTAVVTAGTSGSPADFASFVVADRAGSVTLLAATAGLSPTLPLTYQITPVEKLALLISFVVASKTAEADYIFITGTDAWDAAQTESIDVSAGNGTYVSTKRFRTITNIDCSDNAAGGGTVWADGTVAVTQPQWGVIWDYGNGQYRVDSVFSIGDATTATYFKSTSEAAKITITGWRVRESATLHLLTSRWSCYWSSTGSTQSWGTLILDGSYLGFSFSATAREVAIYSTVDIDNSIIAQESAYSTCGVSFRGANTNINNLYIKNLYYGFWVNAAIVSNKVSTEACYYGIYSNSGGAASVTGSSWAGATVDIRTGGMSGNILSSIDAQIPISTTEISHADGIIYKKCTCNINVCDKDGVAISGAVVDCEDTTATAVWAAGTVTTDASGNITQQTITYKKWLGTAETLTTYSPHKFTISKAGYQTLVLDAITVDHPIVWHLELQPPVGTSWTY